MTGLAFPRRATVDDRIDPVEPPPLVVAQPARHILVRAIEGKRGVASVVELSRLPVVVGMARRADLHVILVIELPGMDIFVTSRTADRSIRKHHSVEARYAVFPAMTFAAGHRPMGAF